MRKSLSVLAMLIAILMATGCGTSAVTTTAITTYPFMTKATTTAKTATTATTAPPTASIAAATTTKTAAAAEPVSQAIKLVSLTSSVKAGSNATIQIQGKPSTEYTCKVRYSSGYSTASGLGDKTSDSKGKVSWTWKVGSNTKPGDYDITISDGDETNSFSFNVR